MKGCTRHLEFIKWWREFSKTWGTCLQREEIVDAISNKLKELESK